MNLGEYLALVPNWHSTQPRYMNHVALLVRPLVEAMEMLAKLTSDFDLDTAVGVQLDQVGRWIGITRSVDMPIAYFSFNTPNLGFNQGHWAGRFDPLYGPTGMDDETYRSVLKLQAQANHWSGVVADIAEAFDRLYPGVVIDDKGDAAGLVMTMDVLVPAGQLSATLLAILRQTFPIKPSGVRVNMLELTVVGQAMFGFNINDAIIAGFNQSAWAELIFSE